jgi:hypothetical protein
MRRIALLILLIVTLPVFSEPITLTNVVGRWGSDNYLFSINKNYTSSVVIYINPSEAFIFNGIYTVEKDTLRININEMKSGSRTQINQRQGFTKTASSRFVFTGEINTSKEKTLYLRPKEIVIDGTNSEGYFDQKMTLKKK